MASRTFCPPGLVFEALFLFLFMLLLNVNVASANYRHFHIENTDICNDRKTGTLEIGTGAVILQLDNPLKIQHEYDNKGRRCEINLKAPPHFGIMVYVEKMHLRKSIKDGMCVDFVQFGLDDYIPFVTINKSERFCGESGPTSGIRYDDPHGSLLIWIHLGGRRRTSYWPEISSVNLTLVVTAYQADCGKQGAPKALGFMTCGDRNKCIYQKYKCDKHYNCATDNGTRPADEMDCVYERDLIGGRSNTSLINNGDGDGGDISAPLNWISWSLIIVSAGLMSLLLTLLCLRCKRNRKCCCCLCCAPTPSASCEFPDQPVIHSLAELSSQRHLHPAEQNIYLPLTTFLEQPIRDRHQQQQQEGYFIGAEVLLEGAGLDYPEEPPPAYNELFPQGSTSAEIEASPEIASSRDHETSEMLSSTPRDVTVGVANDENSDRHSIRSLT